MNSECFKLIASKTIDLVKVKVYVNQRKSALSHIKYDTLMIYNFSLCFPHGFFENHLI